MVENPMIKLQKHNKRKVIYENETYSIGNKKNIAIHVSKQNGKVKSYNIFSSKIPFASKLEKSHIEFTYYYYDQKIFDEFKTKNFTEINFEKFLIPFGSFKDDKEIDLSRVLCPYYNGHMVFCIKDLYPISTVLWFDYIGGVDNEYYYIDKALNYLKNNKFVLEVKKEEIPHYNASFYRTQGLKMKVLFSDKMFRKMWNYVKKDEFPTVRVKELACCHYIKNKIDPLGLKKFVKPESEIKKQELNPHDEDDFDDGAGY